MRQSEALSSMPQEAPNSGTKFSNGSIEARMALNEQEIRNSHIAARSTNSCVSLKRNLLAKGQGR